ncbi:putative TIR domain, winged helix-turn-helix DNA-binding domain-containing protein [Medicago truncatula]|uniref:Putative TIR domain, winged helix-turn-helix DNA-binding domain-containing protein n=1 Tax=Medicago truncatula TaxID=3880 RepID=A0A396JRY0_MEDTR|nr:disease resistance protein RPV1-like [Medicago truncatula]RHN79063.1 putative TIR domain, winged helix-turn-helix DNA-binding domain-containing protein [Medicago truncatula]
MASSSSSFGVSHSSSKQHNVFLSFRGEDTRYNFTSHLYAALCGKKIRTFVDDEEIERGDNISPTLLSAIESSKICVIIFSQDYASSSWCLDELVKIIECSEKKKLVVIPVFYHIDASHVRHQRGTYGDAFAKHEDRFRDNLTKVHMWRTALHKAANLAGWVSEKNRSEAVLIKEIVEVILDKLKCMSPHVQNKGLVGISVHVAHVESMLCSGSADVHIIGIWGMGGIGKTTIADAVFTKVSYQYERYYFAANVRETWGNRIKLQNEVLADVLEDQSIKISTPTMSSAFAVERLKCKKVLVVLDDVSLSEQIEYLVGGRDWFGPGSRIIVTTRNREVFNSGVDEVYQVTVLNSHEALKLFSLNAFQQDSPLIEYQNLSERAVGYAKGIPLALKVMLSALEKLKKYPKAEIYDVLRLSYEGLDPEEQNIFLDIACCLKGQTKSQITSILDACDFSTEIGMRSLEDKSLVTVSKNNTVQMHDLIQEMGRFVESEKKPGERKRLWDPKEIYDVFKHNRGFESIECVVLDMSQIKELTLSPQTFQRTHRLRVLIFYIPSSDTRRINVHISRGLNCMPLEISYFRWDCFPLKSLPPQFCAEKLVELDIKHSRIGKLWDGVQDLVNLKSLCLSGCKNLVELSDLSLASKLEKVHLDDCASLLNVPSYILSLDSLLALNLRGCKQLCYIESEKPSRSLRWLNLRGCSRLVRYSVFSEELEYLNLDFTAIEELPHNLNLLPKLKKTIIKRK